MEDSLLSVLRKICSNTKAFVNLKKYNSFALSSKARYFCVPKNILEMLEVLKYCKENKRVYFLLGGGTNVLFNDGVVEGIIIYTGKLNSVMSCGDDILCAAGFSVDGLSQYAIKKALSGAEFCRGLPGSVGGAVYMNARCYGSEIFDILKGVYYIDENVNLVYSRKEEIDFSYKHTSFMENKSTIVAVKFRLTPKSKKIIASISNKNLKDRKARKQFVYPSAGCVFVNNYSVGMPAGKFIESIGMKGEFEGGAQVSPYHANFIINRKNASARDIYVLMRRIQSKAKDKGVILTPEIRLIGNW